MIVVDASLAAKWLLEERGSPEALEFLQNAAGQLLAPNILNVEVSSAVIRRVNMGELSKDDAETAFAQWDGIVAASAIAFAEDDADRIRSAVTLAFLLGHPLKDCLYLGLAREHDASLATCDQRFAAKARQVYPKIITLPHVAANLNER